MRKLMLAVSSLLSLTFAIPVAAQVCDTVDAVMDRAERMRMPVFYTLHGVDIGDEDKAEVVIFEMADQYLAVAFEQGCFTQYVIMDQSQVEKFINENTKKADGA